MATYTNRDRSNNPILMEPATECKRVNGKVRTYKMLNTPAGYAAAPAHIREMWDDAEARYKKVQAEREAMLAALKA